MRWQLHVPLFYRYRGADDLDPGFSCGWNAYEGHPPLGAYVAFRRYVYCVKWARLG